MIINRRNFFKASLNLLGIAAAIKAMPHFISEAWANACSDEKITSAAKPKQGYVHSVISAKPKDPKFVAHTKKLDEGLVKTGKKAGEQLASCKNCKQYKDAEGDWGKCSMVGATKANGICVYKDGWCKVWAINSAALS